MQVLTAAVQVAVAHSPATVLGLGGPRGAGLDTVIGWFRDPEALLIAMGPWVLLGVAVIVFVESGVLFPFLPGDSLIFAAGLLHQQLGLSLAALLGVIFAAALLGAQVGYWLGRRFGRSLFKPDARVLKTERLTQAEDYFAHYGGRSLVIGRFVPFVRTFVPIAAGVTRYSYPRFTLFNALGSVLWGIGVTYAGVALGGVEFVHQNLEVLILLIVFVSVLPMVWQFAAGRRKKATAPAHRAPTDVG